MKSKPLTKQQRKEIAIVASAVIIMWGCLFSIACYVEKINVNLTEQTDNNQTK